VKSERRTGRTTTIIRAAIAAAVNGDDVVVIVPHRQAGRYCQDMMHDLLKQGVAPISGANRGTIKFTTVDEATSGYYWRGRKNVRAFVDHSVEDCLPSAMIDRLYEEMAHYPEVRREAGR
jgi:hypothetical protein